MIVDDLEVDSSGFRTDESESAELMAVNVEIASSLL
jgi:hypothetical protein